MNNNINLHAMETCDLLANYFGQYANKVSGLAANDKTIMSVVKAFDGFEPHRVLDIIRAGMSRANESLLKEINALEDNLAQLEAEKARLLIVVSEMESQIVEQR